MSDRKAMPYQLKGAAFIGSRYRAGLFDEMGLGKTYQTILALDALNEKRAVVVCPALLRQVWIDEMRAHQRVPRRLLKCRSKHDLMAWARGSFDVLVMSYEFAQAKAELFDQLGVFLPVVVIDESHYLKNPEALRTIALLGEDCSGDYGMLKWAVRCWWLTGTPWPNDPTDVWPMLRFTRATTAPLHNWRNYYMRARPGSYSASYEVRAEHVDVLRAEIAKVAIRRTLADVDLQLPPMFLTELTLSADPADLRPLTDYFAAHPGLYDEILRAVEAGSEERLSEEHIMTARRLVAEAKAPVYARLLEAELRGNREKKVVFGIHREALGYVFDHLNKSGLRAVMVRGGTPDVMAQQAMQSFQNDPACRVFIGNIRSAGTGTTLVASCMLDMFESEWSPAPNAQALKRVHRIGQGRTTTGRFISLAGSIDEPVVRIVARKVRAITPLSGDAMLAAPLLRG